MTNNICIIGLGYVGLPLALAFSKKYHVTGFDINESRIQELHTGYDRNFESNAREIIDNPLLKMSSNPDDIGDANTYIITVPTPIDLNKKPDLEPLKNASILVAKVLNIHDIVIYESTVFPGCTEEFCVPVLEKFSNLTYNKDFYCGYSPERINPGDKKNTLTSIKKITSGSNEDTAKKVNNLYLSIIDAGTHLAPSIKVAEAAKVIENTQRDMNIAIINEFSMIFEKLDINTKEVLDAASTKWNFLPFTPGMVGGHCIGVDPYYLINRSIESGYYPELLIAGRQINDNMPTYIANKILNALIKSNQKLSDLTVGIMGISFKANTPDTRNTKVIELIREIESWGSEVIICDHVASKESVLKEFSIKLEDNLNPSSCDVIVMAVSHNHFLEMGLEKIQRIFKPGANLLVDINSVYSHDAADKLNMNILSL